MQNAQIWKSIEALCNEAESVIKNGEHGKKVIQSIPPPALAYLRTSHINTANILSSRPAPPKANIVNRMAPQENVLGAPLSPQTMTEIAAAIDRASQSAQKPQIMDQPSEGISNQLRKDLMIEVSLAVRSVLENELPKMVRHAISESLYDIINSPSGSVTNSAAALNAKSGPKGRSKKIASKKRAAPKKAPSKKVSTKKKESKANAN